MDEQKIKEAAYALWEKDGKPDGHDLEHWFKASSTVDEDVDTNASGSLPRETRAGPSDETTQAPQSSSIGDKSKRKNAQSR